jgi:hypothetical protein
MGAEAQDTSYGEMKKHIQVVDGKYHWKSPFV